MRPVTMENGKALKAVIFDMDGTLVSTQPLITFCIANVSKKYLKRRLSAQDSLWKFGPPARNIIAAFGGRLPTVPIQDSVHDYHSCYRENLLGKAILLPEIPQLLRDLRDSGRRLSVVTTEERPLAEHCLETFALEDYFEVIVAGDDVVNPKPDPEGILLALRRMNVTARESMIIGDSATDILAGKKAGISTGAALWHPQWKGNVVDAGPDHEFGSGEDLASFLLGTR